MKRFVAIMLIFAVAISGLMFASCKKVEEKKVEEKKLVQEEEWKKLRNNESKYLGSIVTWEIKVEKVKYIGYESYAFGWLGGEDGFGVGMYPLISKPKELGGPGIKLLDLHSDDWIIVTGSFGGVTRDGYIVLKPTAIINKGVK